MRPPVHQVYLGKVTAECLVGGVIRNVMSRGIGSSLGKKLGGTGPDGTSTYKCDKDTMAAGANNSNSSIEVVETVILRLCTDCSEDRTFRAD